MSATPALVAGTERPPPGWARTRLLAAPFLAATAILVVVPAILTVALAFTDYDALGSPRWTGLANFRRLAGDHVFRSAVWNSTIFVLIAVPVRLAVTLGVTLMLARPRRGIGAARAGVYLPTVVPDIAYALVWLWVLNPLYGPLAAMMRAIGLPDAGWLLSPWGARLSIVLMSAFQVGEAFVVALAARHEIPQELYELCTIDGASRWWTFRRLTLPLMAPTLVLLAARDVVLSFQITFVPALVLTGGGPKHATTFLPFYTYQNAFEFLRFGYASAMTIAMYVVTALMVGIQLLVVRRWRSAFEAAAGG